MFSPLQTGLQLFTRQSGVQALADQRVDDFLILLQQGHVCRGMNGLVKISELLPETTGGEQIVTNSNEQVSAVFSESSSNTQSPTVNLDERNRCSTFRHKFRG